MTFEKTVNKLTLDHFKFKKKSDFSEDTKTVFFLNDESWQVHS